VAVVISEIVTELVVAAEGRPGAGSDAAGLPEDVMEALVRRATERVIEVLRREWDR
jgi:hypothetical protein